MQAPKWTKQTLLLTLMLLLFCGLSACSSNPASAYQRAVDAFAASDYEAAATGFERLGDYQQAATYAAYARGMVLFEKADFAAAKPYFEKSKDFMYGQSRYTYCHAFTLESEGNFTQAAEQYLSLGDFENAPACGNYCAARAAEEAKDYETALYCYGAAQGYADATARLDNLQTQVYDYAVQLKSEGNFEQALNLFSKLGDYFDSPAQARQCKEFFREQLYVAAEALENEGKLQEAYQAFLGLAGYSDAETRAHLLAERLGIQTEELEP